MVNGEGKVVLMMSVRVCVGSVALDASSSRARLRRGSISGVVKK